MSWRLNRIVSTPYKKLSDISLSAQMFAWSTFVFHYFSVNKIGII